MEKDVSNKANTKGKNCITFFSIRKGFKNAPPLQKGNGLIAYFIDLCCCWLLNVALSISKILPDN